MGCIPWAASVFLHPLVNASAGQPAQGRDRDAGVLAHPGRVRAAELGVDVERVRVELVAGAAQRPAAGLLEERVLDVLGDEARDVLLALLPLRGPPASGGDGGL